MTKNILLITVAIVLILCLGIVIYQYLENEKNKPRTVTTNYLRLSYFNIRQYIDSNSKFPEGKSFEEIAKVCEIENEARVDFWGTPIQIDKKSEKEYILYSFGPNKQDDHQSGDDIVCGVDGLIRH